MPWVGRGQEESGRERQPDGAGPWGGGLEAKLASVPWGGRRSDAQPAGLGLETCCFGDHPDTILVQGAPTLAGLHAQDQVLPHKLTEPLLISQLPGRLPGPGEAPEPLLQLLLLDIPLGAPRRHLEALTTVPNRHTTSLPGAQWQESPQSTRLQGMRRRTGRGLATVQGKQGQITRAPDTAGARRPKAEWGAGHPLPWPQL